ncbi:MAG: tripartite tricarboxylate transporter permease [Pseudomonadota bacterium]
MDDMFTAAADALALIMAPARLAILVTGVLIGLAIGAIPGLGGIVGFAILIPFTYTLDPYSAMALLIGMAAVVTTGDTIPAVLFGVPGTVAAAATVMDGHPLARQGQAGRALGAAYAASMIGGVFGALLLAVSIPVLRPIVLYLGSPELLSFIVFGLSMVAVLSGGAPLKGLTAACIGLMLAMIGAAPQAGTLRWTLGSLYLWDGLPLVPFTLGLFALPELADLAITRSRIAEGKGAASRIDSSWRGVGEVRRHWWLVLRCSWLGAALGAVPGIGSAVIDWIAYGHAARTEKNTEGFGKGDIRGVIAPESANNAKEGGALVPTIAFGVPGSASMALLLGAFLIHGLVPGPEMLTKHLDVTYSIIWSLALGNVLGAGICLMASAQIAKVAQIPYAILLPVVLAVVYIGALQGQHSWGDLYTLLLFGVIGFAMKRLGWPRPPLILGFVLGDIFERYLFISTERYGAEWLLRPVVALMFAISLWGMYKPMRRSYSGALHGVLPFRLSGLRLGAGAWFTIAVLALVAAAIYLARDWPRGASIVPRTAAVAALIFAGLALLAELFGARVPARPHGGAAKATPVDLGPSVDSEVDAEGKPLTASVLARRAVEYFAWLAAFLALAEVIGIVPAIPVFTVLFIRLAGRESWRPTLYVGFGTGLFNWVVFDLILPIPWPQALLGDWFPGLRRLSGLL